uniref:RNA-dependent RNA polymerase n=1 Tax=Grapevine-associated RNA virus 11 TaxID=2814386 RepID=A0A8F5MKP2_9VIRU|nr:MAG: RNA-dependent RNA polymerase [Grapevine-associated RNA virus 11]
MLGMCISAMRDLSKGKKWDLLADGDNCLLFYEPVQEEAVLSRLPKTFLEFGHEVKVETPTSVLERVTFGQSRPVKINGHYRMIRDPIKAISGMGVGYRHYAELKGGLRVMKTIAQCELSLNTGVPVLQNYAASFLRDLSNVRLASSRVNMEDYRYEEVLKLEDPVLAKETQISAETRESFELAWGLCPERQLELERITVTCPRSWGGVPIDGHPLGRLPGLMLRSPEEDAIWEY